MINVLIFKQDNCAPCKALIDSINDSENLPLRAFENVTFTYYNMSDPSDYVIEKAVRYNVRSAPTVVILKDDKPYYSGTMVKTGTQLHKLIEEAKK